MKMTAIEIFFLACVAVVTAIAIHRTGSWLAIPGGCLLAAQILMNSQKSRKKKKDDTK